ncbi:hypothetical protein [Brevundimonas sp. NPDC058933]|uniref:hypothetical protein n=1 Tax=Brevundimonas sp. NPDC058933 TaxID=3346673 RepID=UPI003BEF41FE
MALPSSGSISIDDIKAELGITGELSLTDQRVRDLAGIQSGSIMLPNDLWGKSARSIRIYISGYEQVRTGFGGANETYQDRVTFAVQVTPHATPSSYLWGNDTFGESATAVFLGPSYQSNGWTYQAQGQAYVSVVIGGQTFEAALDFQYTAGSDI